MVARVRILESKPYLELSLLLVLSLAPRGFFSEYSGFPLPLKTNTSRFQFDLEHIDIFNNEFLRTPKCSVGKQILFNFFISFLYFIVLHI